MIKEYKTQLAIAFFSLFTASTTFALSNLQQQQQNLQQQFMQTAQTAAQQRQAQKQAVMATQRMAAQQQFNNAIQAAENPNSQNQSSQQQNTPTTCDCYNPNVAYNTLPNNFYYNQSHLRVARINPPCQCLPPTQNQLNAIMNAQRPAASPVVNIPVSNNNASPQANSMNANNTTNTNNSTSGGSSTSVPQFNIKYN